jgi:hypothetical protein
MEDHVNPERDQIEPEALILRWYSSNYEFHYYEILIGRTSKLIIYGASDVYENIERPLTEFEVESLLFQFKKLKFTIPIPDSGICERCPNIQHKLEIKIHEFSLVIDWSSSDELTFKKKFNRIRKLTNLIEILQPVNSRALVI